MYTGMPLEKELLVASAFPVVFQWPSAGVPQFCQWISRLNKDASQKGMDKDIIKCNYLDS